MSTVPPTPNVIRLPTPAPPPVVRTPASYEEHRGKGTPLVIDNGATTLRWGWATAGEPFTGPNVIAKYKERKHNKPVLLFGEGVDCESGARAQARTPWEGDVLLNFDALEHALDYAFVQLGIDTPAVEHPVLMTERLSSPLHSRALTSELMFELYSVPSLAYCVDSVMSFYHNNLPPPERQYTADGLVISFNTASTSVVPVLGGQSIMSHAQRIPWGASQASEYLLKLIQLKYPAFPTRVTTVQSSWMLQNLCEFATDYPALLRKLKDPLELRASERIVQFPFTVPVVEEKTEEELARIAEKRKEQGKKLQEMAARNRLERLAQKEVDLQALLNLKERRDKENKKEWMALLQEEGLENEAALDATIKKLDAELKKAKKKEAEDDESIAEDEPSFPLVDVPDADLDEEGLKEKKKQRLMKAGFEARARARREKEREREEREAEERMEDEERERDLTAWANKLRKEHEALINKMKGRARKKIELSDRKSAAAQARMKSIANLAADDRVPKKRRKAGGEDMFGADDADWAIYRQINTAAADSDEEDDLNQLHAIEQKLLAHDPNFTTEHTHASILSQRSALLSAFKPLYEEGDLEGRSRVHLNVERWRVPETWFSPSMAGVDSAGLGEVLQNVMARFSDGEKGKMVQNVFLAGSPSRLPGLQPRIHCTLRPILPPEMPLQVKPASDRSLDAWRGMADFAKTAELSKVSVTRGEYEEWGGERIKRWWGGNWNLATPI
ncbi:actin-like ATPase domain-containing protein [Gloeophyllum trabeum ATCC 11539]|uniref:Actin-like ATPase domain-containing protein n=1 Tax=Gloeophyllum trabeum (strain ATCC 11539 / FP-39264 / Madison 617) TaxID=670483 RepID=S7S190_GLOTA|nr:actin-like ATPase domain-containing protein [Gloeophyllum trabeum ATCC 11539]EPQ61195.1 actin-like ATPase domain-containing protein [Gloeophyllum trabeum ATCC 11539]